MAVIVSYEGHTPSVHPDARVAPTATLVGDVTLEKDASIWYGAVLRGDETPIFVGENSNLQDNVVVHGGYGFGIHVGRNVTVGHSAIIHGCTLGDGCLVGMGAILLNGSVVGEGAMVAAGALVTQGMVIPPYTLAMGSPAKVVRPLTDAERESLVYSAEEYRAMAVQLPRG